MPVNPAIAALDPTRYTGRDKYLLDQALQYVTGGTGGGGVDIPTVWPISRGGTGAATAEDARTNLGLAYSYILNRANHTGLWYAHKWFPNHLAGFVFTGTPNNTQIRWWVNDDFSLDPVLTPETYSTARAGDVVFASAAAGLVLYGRYAGRLERITMDDAVTGDPALIITPLASAASIDDDDFALAQGFEVIAKGRTQRADADTGNYRYYWNIYTDDTQADSAIAIERFAV